MFSGAAVEDIAAPAGEWIVFLHLATSIVWLSFLHTLHSVHLQAMAAVKKRPQYMNPYQLAEINIARMKGVNISDPVMQEFVDNLARVNGIAEQSEGFIWRLKDDNDNATQLNPYNDEQVIINVSVWESFETLEHFMYRTVHSDFLKKRKEWFHRFGKVYTAMWWIKAGAYPTVAEAVQQLDYLQQHGASPKVFDFRNRFAPPSANVSVDQP